MLHSSDTPSQTRPAAPAFGACSSATAAPSRLLQAQAQELSVPGQEEMVRAYLDLLDPFFAVAPQDQPPELAMPLSVSAPVSDVDPGHAKKEARSRTSTRSPCSPRMLTDSARQLNLHH